MSSHLRVSGDLCGRRFRALEIVVNEEGRLRVRATTFNFRPGNASVAEGAILGFNYSNDDIIYTVYNLIGKCFS